MKAISLMSVAVDFGVTQVVDGNWGVHAIIKRDYGQIHAVSATIELTEASAALRLPGDSQRIHNDHPLKGATIMASRWAGHMLAIIATGCAHFPSRHSFGIRSDVAVGVPLESVIEKCKNRHPGTGAPGPPHPVQPHWNYVACLEFEGRDQWSADPEEAYLARASQNRWWIYVAGTLGLAAVGASLDMARPNSWKLRFTPAPPPKSGGKKYAPNAFLDDQELATAPNVRLKCQ